MLCCVYFMAKRTLSFFVAMFSSMLQMWTSLLIFASQGPRRKYQQADSVKYRTTTPVQLTDEKNVRSFHHVTRTSLWFSFEQIWIFCLDEWVFSDCNMELTRRPHGKLRFTCFWDHWRGLEMNVRHQEMKSPSIDRIAERQTVSMITCTKVFELLTVRYVWRSISRFWSTSTNP